MVRREDDSSINCNRHGWDLLDGQGVLIGAIFKGLGSTRSEKIPLLSLVAMELGDCYNYAKDLKID